MNKSLFDTYADLKFKQKAIETQLKELQPQILSELQAVNDATVENETGAFYIVRRKTWTYSPAVDSIVQTLKARKDEEEAKGIATFTEERSLTFKPKV